MRVIFSCFRWNTKTKQRRNFKTFNYFCVWGRFFCELGKSLFMLIGWLWRRRNCEIMTNTDELPKFASKLIWFQEFGWNIKFLRLQLNSIRRKQRLSGCFSYQISRKLVSYLCQKFRVQISMIAESSSLPRWLMLEWLSRTRENGGRSGGKIVLLWTLAKITVESRGSMFDDVFVIHVLDSFVKIIKRRLRMKLCRMSLTSSAWTPASEWREISTTRKRRVLRARCDFKVD